jgi:quercetin dioxygenase-like cupin family protein
MSAIITTAKNAAAFKPERFNPVVLAETQRVTVILVCLEPGQFIPVHRPGVDMARS